MVFAHNGTIIGPGDGYGLLARTKSAAVVLSDDANGGKLKGANAVFNESNSQERIWSMVHLQTAINIPTSVHPGKNPWHVEIPPL